MPNKPHAPRSNVGSKKVPPKVEGADHIVFTNASDEPKQTKGKKKDDSGKDGPPGSKAKGNGKPESAAAEEVPKKPDTRTLIGGASWTGKLPVNLLSEHCQKQKWERPEYSMHQSKDGFSSMVTLRCKNPKTGEVVVLPPFKMPLDRKHVAMEPSAVEARHFAAAYALFRVASMKNIHMTMPPKYRDLWKGDFAEMKKQDVDEGKTWMYHADPFLAKKEKDDAVALAAKKRDEKEKQKEKEASKPGTVTLGTGENGANAGPTTKGWTKAPQIDMGKKMRREVEGLVRRKAAWNPHDERIPQNIRTQVVDGIAAVGFRRSHVEEAAERCKDREEILEWLLIHVPEDDLPPWALPKGYIAGVSMASVSIKREAIIRRLAAAGYSYELCEELLDMYGGEEAKAAEELQNMLVGGSISAQVSTKTSSHSSADGEFDIWTEEQGVIASIFEGRIERASKDMCSISLEVPMQAKPIRVNLRRPSKPYPQALPVISIHAELPSYIRLSIVRQALDHARLNLLGDQMIFSLVDWLEQEIPRIVENPGRLVDISVVTSTGGSKLDERTAQKVFKRHAPKPLSLQPGSRKSLDILAEWQARQLTAAQYRMNNMRQNLPAWKLQEAIVDAVNMNQVTIISGETGSGKSTQSVQFILDDLIQRQLGDAANIVCTQPRRISALSLADRVADERCGVVGDEVGYAIRGESRQKPGTTKITFVTTGVLLRRLQASGGSSEQIVAALADVSHVVVDEVHERSLDTDFLLILLRDILRRRKDLKVVLMSATLNADVFERYFAGQAGFSVGRIEIMERTYPVDDYYLDDIVRMTGYNVASRYHEAEEGEDTEADSAERSTASAIQKVGMKINYDLISSLVYQIDKNFGSNSGGILIFLPGTFEISKTLDALRSFANIHALPLHASLLPSEQRRVFPPAPAGKRKVIVSTNVAETSITIEDIVAVIDTGRVKETSFDPVTSMVKLQEVWASRAACKQRRGRAGRVQAGKCYKLYTRNAEAKMAERPEPETKRVPLEQLCLSVKAMGVADVLSFLRSALTPPEDLAIEGALSLLRRMGALDGDVLTALGKHLAMIPADLRCSKLMVYGATFGCLEACLTIAAILAAKSPFVSPQSKRDESKAARQSFGQGQGDLIADLRAYEAWNETKGSFNGRALRTWCDEKFLSTQTLNDISSNRSQYISSLKEIGFLPLSYHRTPPLSSTYNTHSSNTALLRALIAGSFNPQLSRVEFPSRKYAPSLSGAIELDPEARTIKYFTHENGRVFVHPGSTLFDAQSFPGGNAVGLSWFGKISTSKTFIRELTPFNAYTLLLFCGSITLDTLGRGLLIDDHWRLRGWARIGVLVSRLRILLDDVLARKVDDPGLDISRDEVVAVVRKMVELDGMDH